MKYFETLPKIVITDTKNTSRLYTNILARASIIQSLLKNPLIFYDYNVQESDTPEIIAYKYYGDINKFWLVLFANQIIDPQWDWPLNNSVLNSYINKKYTPSELTEVYEYQKIITKKDNNTNTTTVETIAIDEATYNSLATSTNTYSLPTGSVTVSVTKNIVDNFQHELILNESKRSIKLINNAYSDQLENELRNLMKV
jgi:hypothetical protein